MKLTKAERHRIGQALNDAIADGAPNTDWADSREVDRLVDAVATVLESIEWRMRPPLYSEGPEDPELNQIVTAHDGLMGRADALLRMAKAAFVAADHPFPDVERLIQDAIDHGDLEDKIARLHTLPPMLEKSDMPFPRWLGGRIKQWVGDTDAGSTYV